MGLISFIRDFNKPVDMPQAERDAIMAKALAEYDAEMEALNNESLPKQKAKEPSLDDLLVEDAIRNGYLRR